MAGPALETWIQLRQELRSSPSAGPGGSGAGPLICSARGRSVLAVLGPPGLCLSRGRPDPGLCPGTLCSRSVLLDSCSWPPSHLSPELPPSPSELLLVMQPPQGAAA